MNTMTLKTLAAAVALGCAGSASAIPLTSFVENATQVTLRSAGSTAHDPGLLNVMRITTTGFQMCIPGSLDVYTMANANLNIYFCSAGANSGFTGANRRIALLRNGSYGSGSGVSNLVRGTSTAFDDAGAPIFSDFPDVLAGTTVSAAPTTTIAGVGQLSSYVVHGGVPTITTTAVADMGITDEEPALFKTVFNPDVSSSELSKLTVKGISGVIFGVPVTRNIFARLQALQFDASTSSCHPSNAGYGSLAGAAAAANSEACMPSLSREQVSAIYKGDIASWSSLVSATGTANAATVLADSAAVGTLTDSTLYVERRVPVSGTQLANQTYFLAQGCVSSALPFIKNVDAARVTEHGGSGNVRTGLVNRNTAGQGAIGVLSTESATTAATAWRFVKINGYAPSLLNVVKGNYDFFFESSLQYRGATVGGVAALTTAKKSVANQIAVLLGNPASVAALDAGFSQVYGARGGLVANAVDQVLNATVPPYAVPGSGGTSDVNVRPVATSTRGPGGVPDACLTPARVGGFQVGN